MHRAIQAIATILFVLFTFVAVILWVPFDKDPPPLIVRLTATLIAVGGLGTLLWTMYRGDLVPDMLRAARGEYFQRAGLAFLPEITVVDGACVLLLHFQNQFSRPCNAVVQLTPLRSASLSKPFAQKIRLEFDCGPAAYGTVARRLSLPRACLGKSQTFKVGCGVKFPAGRGRQVRFRTGMPASSVSGLESGVFAVLSVFALAVGAIVVRSSSKVTVRFPASAAAESPPTSDLVNEHWVLGQDPLPPNAA